MKQLLPILRLHIYRLTAREIAIILNIASMGTYNQNNTIQNTF